MSPVAVRNGAAVLAAAAIVAGFWWQGEQFIAGAGPTFDEPAHLAAGYGYWTTGDFRLNPEHPPLLKMLWALPLVLGDRPPFPADVAAATNNDHWQVGDAFLFESGISPARLLIPARRMNLALGCGIVLLAGWWAFRIWGSRLAGLAASAFAAWDPTLLALSCVLSTDAGLAFFTLLSAYLLWEYVANPSRGLLIALGVSLGLLLGSKFSAVGVVAAFGVAAVVYVLRGGVLALPGLGRVPRCGARLRAAFDLAMRLGLIAAVVLAATYGFVHAGHWAAGLKFQLTRSAHGDGIFYFRGELSRTGWYGYFLTVLPLKLPLGLLLGAVLGTITVATRWWERRDVSRTVWLFIPPLVFFVLASYSRVDVGVRVMLPAIVFLYVIAAALAASCTGRPARLILLTGCLFASGWAAWHAGARQLTYFNEVAGGSRGGLRFAADSNLDWGQGLPQLKEYMRREGIEVVYLSYFGTDRPEAHGIRYQALPSYGRLGRAGGEAIPADAPRHVVAVSASHLVGLYLNDPDAFTWLRDRPPTAVVAGCIYVFDLTGDEAGIRRVQSLRIACAPSPSP